MEKSSIRKAFLFPLLADLLFIVDIDRQRHQFERMFVSFLLALRTEIEIRTGRTRIALADQRMHSTSVTTDKYPAIFVDRRRNDLLSLRPIFQRSSTKTDHIFPSSARQNRSIDGENEQGRNSCKKNSLALVPSRRSREILPELRK